uniref:Oxidoreductase dhs-27 n=1 Tax=Ascaris suum TaxID=6253 RepID=F1L5N6_ASCSU
MELDGPTLKFEVSSLISSPFIMIVSLACAYDMFKLCVTSYVVVRFLKFLFVVCKSIVMHYIWPEMDISDLKEMWTVVTGCTDGIGRAYVEELAISRGIRKFFLIGRNAVKLGVVRKEMEERYAAQIQIHVFDLEKDDLDTLREVLKGLEVGILVNCAGIGPHLVANLMELPEGLPSKILRVNILATVKLIEIVMPGMIRRNKGIIVNVSSITCWRPLPYMSAYPASKAAMSFFSEALHDEFKHTNVHVQVRSIPLFIHKN